MTRCGVAGAAPAIPCGRGAATPTGPPTARMPLNTPTIVLIAVAVIALIVWGGIVGARKRRERIAAFERLAAERGLVFDTERDREMYRDYPKFAAFQRGDDQEAYDTMRGDLVLFDEPCRLIAGEFEYETEDSDGDTDHHQFSFVLVHLPFTTPSLELRRENLFDKLAAAIGFDDIDFESDEFSRRYHVVSDDKRFAYDVLHPRMLAFLLDEQADAMQLYDGVLCITDGTTTWSPDEFARRIDFVERLCALWPRHLLST